MVRSLRRATVLAALCCGKAAARSGLRKPAQALFKRAVGQAAQQTTAGLLFFLWYSTDNIDIIVYKLCILGLQDVVYTAS